MYRVIKDCVQYRDGTAFAHFIPGEFIDLPEDEAKRLVNEGCVETASGAPTETRKKRGRPRKKK